MSHVYDPHKRVAEFHAQHGALAIVTLEAWNDVDPFHCFFGFNVDEYLGYAERFVALSIHTFDHINPSLRGVKELVRRSFHAVQVIEGDATPKIIYRIANTILQAHARGHINLVPHETK